MAARGHRFVVATLGAALLVGMVLLLRARGEMQTDGRAAGARSESGADGGPPRAQVEPSPAATGAAAMGAAVASAPAEATPPPPSSDSTPPSPPPRDPLESPEWRSARLAFRPRDLGKLGPYVKAGLDAARRDMAFCFREAGTTPEPPPQDAADDAPPPLPADPTILLLYLEAREGALDVVAARMDHRGASTPELVECCREVLRGLEIPAFGAKPGQRYRVKYRLQ